MTQGMLSTLANAALPTNNDEVLRFSRNSRTRAGNFVYVQTHRLTKRYGRFKALDDFSFGVERGEVVGLLGPNGAGKTTLLRLLMGFLRPSSGRASIDDFDCYHASL